MYCDFFSTTLLERRQEYVEALLKEIDVRKNEAGEPVRTIYMGGGTPSTLAATDIKRLLDAVGTQDAEEITMEINPGDADETYLSALRETGINRLSIGIQSFHDELLTLIGRRHNAQQAIEAVQKAQQAGFDNVSIDLMYALPTQTPEQWQSDIETALSLNVQHISSYGLMYEEGTVLFNELMNERIKALDEETENAMYDTMCERLQEAGFVHYEVSNFALPGREAKHNSNYWNGTPYVGVGAGAHSYIGNKRSWNPDDLEAYIKGLSGEGLAVSGETLTEQDRYNERIMLGLRTNKGVAREDIHTDVKAHIETGLLREQDGRIIATQKGIHILNRIIEDLMI